MIFRFASVRELVTQAQDKATRSAYWNSFGKSNAWDLNISSPEACKRALDGDLSLVASATDAVDKIKTHFSDVPRLRTAAAFEGSHVSVPAYLSGAPMAMRKRVKRPEAAPTVAIYVGTTCSAGVPASHMLQRGCVILAFLELLQARGVQVDLFLVSENHGATDGDQYQVIPIESRPLDLSTAAFAIAHPAFARNVCYPLAEVLDNYNGNWPYSYDVLDRGGPRYQAHVRKVLGLADSDVYIPSCTFGDPLLKTPDAWLQERLSQF